MATAPVVWPAKTREVQSAFVDSTRWNGFAFRDGDIVIATMGKSGTTWMQQIVGQLIFRGAEGMPVMEISPWLDIGVVPIQQILERLEAQTHRRFIKTHLPLDALVFSPKAKYIFVARDGRDVAWSWYNHMMSFSDAFMELANNAPGRAGPRFEKPKGDVVQYFREWLDGGGFLSAAEFWPHHQGWWDARHLPNVLLVHFNDLKADLSGQMRRIAAFLDIEIEEELWPTLVAHCAFDYMKRNANTLSPMLGVMFEGGGQNFVHKGTNGRWRDRLTQDDIAKYERLAAENLSPDCARWLATGEMA